MGVTWDWPEDQGAGIISKNINQIKKSWGPGLVFYCYGNKLPHTLWLKMTQIY